MGMIADPSEFAGKRVLVSGGTKGLISSPISRPAEPRQSTAPSSSSMAGRSGLSDTSARLEERPYLARQFIW